MISKAIFLCLLLLFSTFFTTSLIKVWTFNPSFIDIKKLEKPSSILLDRMIMIRKGLVIPRIR